MLQPLGIVLILATVVAVISLIAQSLFERTGARLTAAAFLGGWSGVVVVAAMSGALENLLVLLGLFCVPIVAAIILSFLPDSRERLLRIPQRQIFAINGLRILGALFIGLTFAGQLGGPFPWFAGIGDIVTGLTAIALALQPASSESSARTLIWNTFGALDLVVAVSLGILSANGSPIELIHAGAGSAAIRVMPWALVPGFLVPCYLVLHAIVYAKLAQNKRSGAVNRNILRANA
jgi:hypothetical protein